MARRWLKIALIAAAVVTAVVAGLVWFAYGKEITLRIPQRQIQEALDAKFPLEKKYLLIFTVRYANPVVTLDPGADRIHVGLDAETVFIVNGKTYGGSALVSGSVAYEPSKGEFNFMDSRIEKMSIAGIPEKYSNKVNEIGTLLLRQYLDHKPIYRLSNADTKQSLAKLVLKRVRVKEGQLEVVMGIGP